MPEMLESVQAADHKNLVADYGDGKLVIRVPGSIPWWKFAGADMQRLFKKLTSGTVGAVAAAKGGKKKKSAVIAETAVQSAFDEMSFEERLQFSAELMITLGSWDMTKGGAPVPLTVDSFAAMGSTSPATAFSLITQFIQFLPEMLAATTRRADAAKKSRGGNLPSLSHGRRGRRTGRRVTAAPRST